MRILCAGGGTGGHIFPALAVAQALRASHPHAELAFAGAQGGLEADLVPRAGFEFIPLVTTAHLSAGTLRPLLTLLRNLPNALRFLADWQPHAVLGTGGYASAVTVFAAAMLRVPTMVLDFNAIPGRINRLLAPLVDCIGVAFAPAQARLAHGRCVVTGLPLRREFQELQRDECRAQRALREEELLLLVYGGSQGARRLNQATWGALDGLLERNPRLRVVHLCGTSEAGEAELQAARLAPAQRARYQAQAFAHDLPQWIAAADLAVCRAGGGMLELAARGVPMVLVPLPNARDDHQLHNARCAEAAGCARVVLDRALTSEQFAAAIQPLLDHETIRLDMARKCQQLAQPGAAERVRDLLLELALARRPGPEAH